MAGDAGVTTTASTGSSTALILLFTLIGIIGGLGNAAAVTLGATLTEFTGSGLRSAWVNFFVACVLLYSAVLIRREWRVNPRPCVEIFTTLPWYVMMAPGFLGSTYVTCSVLLLGQIEYASFSVFNLGGQFLSSNVIDHFGLVKTPRNSMNLVRLFGFFVVLIGAMCVQGIFQQLFLDNDNSSSGGGGSFGWAGRGWAGLSLLDGCILPFQAVFNRNATGTYKSPLITPTVSFTFGLLFLTLWGSLSFFLQDPTMKIEESSWFNWCGGVGGTIFVSTQAFVPKILGTGLYFACVVLGQLIVAVLIDATKFLPGAKTKDLTVLRIIGLIIVFLGTIIVQLDKTVRSKNIRTWAQFKTWVSGGGAPPAAAAAGQTAVAGAHTAGVSPGENNREDRILESLSVPLNEIPMHTGDRWDI